MKYRVKQIALWILVTLAILTGAVFLFFNLPFTPAKQPIVFGVTFTPSYAEYLGLDWKKTYLSVLDDMGVRNFRLSVFWNETEPKKGKYNFERTDFQLDEAEKRDANVILAVGRKLPRWPECHDPEWIKGYTKEQIENELLEYVRITVEHYKNHPAIHAWQVENEPFFRNFGICENYHNGETLQKEIDLIKSIDNRPVIVTESGEWSTWLQAIKYADILGISMYRESWSDWFGQLSFPIGPGYYQGKADLLSSYQKRIIITELQVEPWAADSLKKMTTEEMRASMPIEKMLENITFARNVGFDETYLWGVEWWYFMKEHGDDSYWNTGRRLYSGGL